MCFAYDTLLDWFYPTPKKIICDDAKGYVIEYERDKLQTILTILQRHFTERAEVAVFANVAHITIRIPPEEILRDEYHNPTNTAMRLVCYSPFDKIKVKLSQMTMDEWRDSFNKWR